MPPGITHKGQQQLLLVLTLTVPQSNSDLQQQCNPLNSHNCHATLLSPSLANAQAPLTTCYSLSLDLGLSWQEKSDLCLNGDADAYTGSALNLCAYTIPTCLSIPLNWGKCPSWGEKEKHTQRVWDQLEPGPQSFCSSNLEEDTAPDRVVTPLSREEVSLTPCAGSSSSITSCTTYQGYSWKDETGVHLKSSLLTKRHWVNSLHMDAPTKKMKER